MEAEASVVARALRARVHGRNAFFDPPSHGVRRLPMVRWLIPNGARVFGWAAGAGRRYGSGCG